MKFSFMAEKVACFPVQAMCRVLGVSPSGYYAWRRRPKSARARDDERLVLEVQEVHEQSRGIYGSPRVTEELRARGRRVGKKRVARTMRDNGLKGRTAHAQLHV